MNVTARRRRVKNMVSAGWKHREVAEELGITMRTVGRDVSADVPDQQPQPPAPRGGACEDADADVFFPEHGDAADALTICLTVCGVLERCARFALNTDTFNTKGVIGGLTPNDRRKLRRGDATVEQLHAANRSRLGLVGGEPAGPGGPSAPTAAGPETSGPPSGAANSIDLQ